MENKITVTSVGTTANVNATPDSARYYSDKSKEWAIGDKLIDNEDYSSKYYANESKKQADISTAKTTEVVESGNTAVSNIESARDNAITDITNQENVSVDNVNTAGETQVSSVNTAGITQVANVNSAGTTQINLAKEQVTLATNQANIAKEQATIATNKTTEVVASGNEALTNIDTAKTGAITDITDLKNDSISSMETAKSGALTEIETLHSSSVTDITGLKNTSITDITNLKNTSISNITTAKNSAIATITTQETTSKNNVIATGNEQVERIHLAGIDNKLPMFTKGEKETNEGVYQNVYDLKHSTFDKSKFTVVGSPTITEDGIASGFSATNYLTADIPAIKNLNSNSILEVYLEVKAGEALSNNDFALYSGKSNRFGCGFGFGGISVRICGNLASGRSAIGYSITPQTNTTYKFYAKVDFSDTDSEGHTGSIYGEVKDENDNLLVSGKDFGDTYGGTFYGIDVENYKDILYLGTEYNKNNYWKGSTELYNLVVLVDGVEVFNGNKTGLDVIKPDDYTVVGTPTISADGIASGFSDSNYITHSITNLTSTSILEAYAKVVSPSPISGHCVALYIGDSSSWGGSFVIEGGDGTIRICGNSASGVSVIGYSHSGVANTTYNFYMKVDFSESDGQGHTGSIYGELRDVDGNLIASGKSYGSSVGGTWYGIDYTHYNGLIYIGKRPQNNFNWNNGSIDLNAFKIYVDGNLVYQPCLKIPYTQSKTGSKIVDVAYRDRVIDLYKQEGQAGYYTIDGPNKNFTLPMGEIYGMIGQRSLISSTVTETNRVDIYSDKTCLICGNVATAGTINLPIELANNNYFITLSTSTKTATSFTTTATGDYILIGKVL